MSFHMDAAVARIDRENKEYASACLQRKLLAQAEARRLAKRLMEADPALARVWGFGSTFGTGLFTLDSDIDLATEGGNDLLALRVVEDSEFSIDVVDISDREDWFVQNLRATAVLLGGKL